MLTATILRDAPGRPLLVLGPSLGTSVETLWSRCVARLGGDYHVVGWDQYEPVGDGEPGVELAVAQLDDAVTARAHEVVMVTLAAEAVARLAAVVHQNVYDAGFGEALQRPVDGREADALSLVEEQRVDLLRRRVVA